MPTLQYRYVMNEPFVNGTKAQTQYSDFQYEYKKQRDHIATYGDPSEKEKRELKDEKTMKEEIQQQWQDFKSQAVEEGERQPDYFLIKWEGVETCGLEVRRQKMLM